MSTIVVAGGTGTVGSAAVSALADAGHRPRIASRRPRPAGAPTTHEWATVDYRTGAGLQDALAGANGVIVVTGAMRETAIVHSILAAAPPELHVVYLSIVGVDRVPMPYYRAKYDAEQVLATSRQPWTVLRATQFHSLALSMVRGLTAPPVAVMPRSVMVQPVAAREVGARLAGLAVGGPQGRAPDFGGPEVLSAEDLVGTWLRATGRRRPVVPFRMPGRLVRSVADGGLLTPHRDGTQTFAEFVADRV